MNRGTFWMSVSLTVLLFFGLTVPAHAQITNPGHAVIQHIDLIGAGCREWSAPDVPDHERRLEPHHGHDPGDWLFGRCAEHG
jgi:hypothetical protein